VWKHPKQELVADKDSQFLLDGVQNGFYLSDDNSVVAKAEARNHKSANDHRELVEQELIDQINMGNYVVASTQPAIVSPLAAIPKKDGGIRLIHDASRPHGAAMNDYASLDSVKFQTIEDACKLAKPGYYCAKVDLQSAYRSVAIHPSEYKMTGLKWKFSGQDSATYLFDTRLPFGSRRGPAIFHRISQAVKRCMQRKGFKDIVVYIDDFLIVAPTYERCNEALHVLISLLRRLGFCISWQKLVGPTQRLTFLGIDIDTVASTLSLGPEKLIKLDQQLEDFWARNRATKQQLQSLAGLLNWACSVVRGGKFFLRRILDSILALKQAKHKVRLSREFKQDIEWWRTYLHCFNGVVYFDEQSRIRVHVDACNKAAGAFWQGNWRYTVFDCDMPAVSALHINYKEVAAVVEAVKCWAPFWGGQTVIVHTDSTVTKSVINKGRSRNKLINAMLRNMFWVCAKYNCKVIAITVSGCINIFADTISRLHEHGNVNKLAKLLRNWFSGNCSYVFDVTNSMSKNALVFLLRRLQPTIHVPSVWSELNNELATYRASAFAMNTKKTYATHLRNYLNFCEKLKLTPAPVTEHVVALYATYLARTLKPSSVRQYLNIVRLVHLESGFQHPYKDSWMVTSTLRGIDRTKGCEVSRKKPITAHVLLQMRIKLNLQATEDILFWAACLVMFFLDYCVSLICLLMHQDLLTLVSS